MRLKLHHLPEPVARRLRRFHLAQQARRSARWALAALAIWGLLLTAGLQLDRFLFLETGVRVALLWSVHGAAVGAAIAGFLSMLLRRRTSRDLAYAFESSVEQSANEHYVTLDHVMSQDAPDAGETRRRLVDHLTRGTVVHAEQALQRKAGRDRVMRLFLAALAVVAILAGALSLWPGYHLGLMLKRFYHPRAPLPKPGFLSLDVSPAEPLVGRGEELAVQVTVQGRMPRALEWLYRKAGHSSGRCVLSLGPDRPGGFPFSAGNRVDMSRVRRDLFLFSKSDMASNFNFMVRCGDAQTGLRHVEVVAQPSITGVTVSVTPPAYSGLPMQTLGDLAQPMQFLPGSKIVVAFRTDQPVPKREVRFEKLARPLPHAWDEARLSGTFEFTLKARTAFEIAVVNRYGFANRERVRAVINLHEDQPPTVLLDDPPPDVEKVAGELIAFRAALADDLGLRELALRYRVNPDPEEETPIKELPIPLGDKPGLGTNVVFEFDLEKTGAVPGDLVWLQLRARDTAGNDGVSRDTRVRVLPFTRDENERLRLRALAFVRDALAPLGAAAIPAYAGPDATAAPMDEGAASALRAGARTAGVPYADGATWAPLFDLLEREQYFTDRSRHKDDVRMIRAVLWTAVNAAAPGGGKPSRECAQLSEMLPGLTGLRQAKNLTWRMFGMRRETERLLADFSRPSDADASGNRSLERRLDLYLTAVQDIGEELVTLNAASRWMDPEELKRQVGAINTAAYSVKRGTAARRRTACRQAEDGLDAALRGIHAAYVPLLKAEVATRARLAAWYQACLAATVLPAGDLTPARATAAAAWLEEDGRLMAWNPFQPLWARALNGALLNGIEETIAAPAGEAVRRQAASAWLTPAGELQEPIGRERRGRQRMAFEWENRTALAEPVTARERALQVALAELEEDAANNADQAAGERRLAGLEGATHVTEAVLGATGFRDGGASSAGPLYADSDAAAAVFRTRNLLSAPGPLLIRFGKQFDAVSAVVAGRLSAQNRAADGRELADRVTAEIRSLQALAWTIELDLHASRTNSEAAVDEWLLVNVRESRYRYSLAVLPSLNALRKDSAAGSAEETAGLIRSETEKVQAAREPLRKALDAWSSALEKGGPLDQAEKDKHPVLQGYDRSRDVCRVLAEMRRPGANPAELSARMRERYPDLALGYLAEGLRHVVAAAEAVGLAGSALRRSPPDTDRAAGPIAACRAALGEFKRHVNRAGAGEEPARAMRAADDLLRQMDSIRNAGKDTAAVSRQVFVLGELDRGLSALKVELRSAAEAGAESFSLTGGPAGAWGPESRLSAERSRKRLSQQMQFAARAAQRGILDAGDPAWASELPAAAAWAALAFDVDRSDLNPSEGVRLAGSGAEDAASPLVKFLRDEIQKARQMPALKYDAEAAKQYLDALYDYLRY